MVTKKRARECEEIERTPSYLKNEGPLQKKLV